MKILIVTGIFPPDQGGPAGYVASIAAGLQRLGHTVVSVITLSDRHHCTTDSYSFPVVRLPRHLFRPLRWIRTIFTVARLARQADVVFLNGLVCEGILATRYVTCRPVVVKVVGDLVWEKARNIGVTNLELDSFQKARLPWSWAMLKALQAWYTASANGVITPSQYLSNIVAGWGVPKHKIHVVHNAVAIPPPNGAQRKDYDLVTACRLVPWKGVSNLIKVTQALKLRLLVLGDGPLRSELEALAKSCGAAVSFSGYVSPERLPDEMRRAQLFVLNSSYEGMPHIVLEAKAASVAVLATDAGGTPETISHGINGWLVPANDMVKLSSGIQKLLREDSLRISLAEAGFNQIAQGFDLNSQLDKTAIILSGVCK
jgi:glycosyltransferase involved in cell wall biosynthesis